MFYDYHIIFLKWSIKLFIVQEFWTIVFCTERYTCKDFQEARELFDHIWKARHLAKSRSYFCKITWFQDDFMQIFSSLNLLYFLDHSDFTRQKSFPKECSCRSSGKNPSGTPLYSPQFQNRDWYLNKKQLSLTYYSLWGTPIIY